MLVKRWPSVLLLAAGLTALALVAVACGDDDEEPTGEPTAAGEPTAEGEAASTVGVSLIEWSVLPDETFAPGGTETASFDLEPGNYVLICNVLHEEESGEVHRHYQLGMRTAFEVTE